MVSALLVEATGEPLSYHAARLETDSDRASVDCSPSIRTASDHGACCSTEHALLRLPIHDEFSLVLYFAVSPLRSLWRCSAGSMRTTTAMKESNDDVWSFLPDARAGRNDPCRRD